MNCIVYRVGRQVKVFHQKDCFSSRRRAPGAFTVQQQEEKEEEEEEKQEWGRLCGSLNFILLRNHRGGNNPSTAPPPLYIEEKLYENCMQHF